MVLGGGSAPASEELAHAPCHNVRAHAPVCAFCPARVRPRLRRLPLRRPPSSRRLVPLGRRPSSRLGRPPRRSQLALLERRRLRRASLAERRATLSRGMPTRGTVRIGISGGGY